MKMLNDQSVNCTYLEEREGVTTINLFEMFKDDFLGSRYDGEQVRKLEDQIILENKQKVVLNFKNMNETVKLILNVSIKLSIKFGQKIKSQEDI